MQALVLEGIHQPLQWLEVPDPVPAADEVVVQLQAAALNHRDVWIQKGQYAGLRFPAILGSDGAGVVTGAAEANAAWIGKEVIINPGIHWGTNPQAQTKSFKILGMPDPGTFAQYVKVPATHVVPKPAHLTPSAVKLPVVKLR